ncbi:hypothetical protein HKD37_19G053740 [Glycine soja]
MDFEAEKEHEAATLYLSLSIIFPFVQPKNIPSTTLQLSKLKVPTQASSFTHLSLSTITPPPSKTSFKSTISANPLHAPLSLAPYCPRDPSNAVVPPLSGFITTSASSTISASLLPTMTPSPSSPFSASTRLAPIAPPSLSNLSPTSAATSRRAASISSCESGSSRRCWQSSPRRCILSVARERRGRNCWK